MDFKITKKGQTLIVSSGHKLIFEVDIHRLSDKALDKYGNLINGEKLIYKYPFDAEWEKHEEMCVYVSEKEEKNAVEISRDLLEGVIKSLGESSVIYTGAGISKSAGIMTFEELSKLFHINEDDDSMLEAIIEKSDYILAQFKMFTMRLKLSAPTIAHYKIAELIKKTKCRIVSENLDSLHIKTGIFPIFPNDKIDLLMQMKPDIVLLIGVGTPMCSAVFDKWYENGATFYSINRNYSKMNVPVNIYVGDIQEFWENE